MSWETIKQSGFIAGVVLFQFGFDVLCFNFFFSYSNKDVNAEIVQTYTGSSDSLPALVLVDYREVCSSCVE